MPILGVRARMRGCDASSRNHYLREKLPRERAVKGFIRNLDFTQDNFPLGFRSPIDNPIYKIQHLTPSDLIGECGDDLSKIFSNYGLYGLALYVGCKIGKIMPELPKKTSYKVKETEYIPCRPIRFSYRVYFSENEHGELLDFLYRFGIFGRCHMEDRRKDFRTSVNADSSITYDATAHNIDYTLG